MVGSGFYNDAAPDGALLAPADAKTDGQIIFTGSEFNAANRIGRQISRQVMLGSRSIMASIDFYALKEDIRVLIHAIFVESDIRIFESYSRYDEELREFRSFDELAAAFSLGSDPHGNGHAVLLQLWSSSVMPKVEFERITLKVAGHSFRYRISGVGLIQLYFGGEHEGIITDSHYGHWSEAGARQRVTGNTDAVDWSALSRLSGRIQRHIRSKMAVAKVRSRPIFPAAFAGLQRGLGLRYSSLQFHADSPDIQLLRGTAAQPD